MKRSTLRLLAMMAILLIAAVPASAGQLSSDNLERLDRLGVLTPAFKTAVHELVETKQQIVAVKNEKEDLSGKLPALQAKAAEAQKKVDELKLQLAEYDHSDQKDFDTLKKTSGDAAAKPADIIIVAQAYLWAYPASAHQAEAQQVLQAAQKQIADQIQADKDAAAKKAADWAALLERVKARSLSLEEWRKFLTDLSQEEVIKYIGRPQQVGNDYWTYTVPLTTDPDTGARIGLELYFDALRVKTVGKPPKS
jgi:peptidoglycan hydrolase CwlO-like protein